MRNLNVLEMAGAATRLRGPQVARLFGNNGDERNGAFTLSSPLDGMVLQVIASSGGGWDHVSVSRRDRCPTWDEMEHVKRTFFKDDEMAMQLHVPPAAHINRHPYCLHLWRPLEVPIPCPPVGMV